MRLKGEIRSSPREIRARSSPHFVVILTSLQQSFGNCGGGMVGPLASAFDSLRCLAPTISPHLFYAFSLRSLYRKSYLQRWKSQTKA